MKQEQQALMVSGIINIIVSFLKIWGGILFGSYTLLASGYYTICDFSTDVIAMIGARVGKKRANKKHPFGYGKFEYGLQIALGTIIIIVGIYVGIRSFFLSFNTPNIKIIFVILLVLLLKVLSSNYLLQKGKDISSKTLISSAKESFLDVLSLIIVLFIVSIGQVFVIIDIVGCLLMALLIIYEGLQIVFDNIIASIGVDDNNKKIKDKLKKIIDKEENVKYSDAFLLKIKDYYQATIEIAIKEDVKIIDLFIIEYKLRKKIKMNILNIKYIDFNIIKD